MKKKNLSKLVALAVLLGGVTYSGSVWATEIKIQGDSQPDPSTYSTTIGVGVDATAQTRSLDANVSKIETASGGVAVAVYGIKTENSYGVTATSITDGINVKSTAECAYAIFLKDTGTNTISGLGNITAESSGSGKVAYGIYANNKGSNTFSVGFADANGSISVYSASGVNYGIQFVSGSTGTSEVKDVKIITAGVKSGSTDSSSSAYGIYAQAGTNTVTFTGAGSSITAKSSGSGALGICASATGTNTISGLGSITAETSGSSKTAYGIYAKNGNAAGEAADPATFSITMTNGTISAYSASGTNYGIYFVEDSTGTSEVKNVKTITAGVKNGSVDSSGKAYGIYAEAGVNNVAFTGAGSSITAKSSGGYAYGISLSGTGTNTISGLGNITAETTGNMQIAGGIRSKNTGSNTFSVGFDTTGGTINAYSAIHENYGIWFVADSTGTSEVKNVKTITAGVATTGGSISSGIAYGICAEAGTNTVTFTGTDSSITAKSSGNNVYGIAFGNAFTAATGTTTITGLGNITAETAGSVKSAYGIYSKNTNTDNTKKFSVAFDSTNGGTISAYSASSSNLGIFFETGSTGKSEVKNVKTITVGVSGNNVTTGAVNGIYAVAGVNNVTFTGADSSIMAKSNSISSNANGITLYGGTNTISNLGSINAIMSNNNTYATGIFSQGGTNTISFKGNGGQAITATAATPANATSIYVVGEGATTVNFESSILSGKVYQGDTATLTLNFNDGGVWNYVKGDVTGKVDVNVNNGGTIVFDLPATTAANDTIFTTTGTVTIADTGTIRVINGKATQLQEGDEICLIDNGANITLGSNVTKQHSSDGITWSEAEIYTKQDDAKKLMYKKTKMGLDPDGSKAPVEGMAAAAASVNTSSDLVTGAGMANMITSTAAAGGGAEPFAAASFGSSRLETGSHVDSKGYGIVVGVGKKVFNKAGNKTTGGIFVEYGNSDTDTYNNAVTGSGKSINKGVGYMMRYDHTSGNYYEGMIHAGKINSSWANSTGGYSMSPTYFGGALTYGHKFMVAEDRQLSVYGSYIYGRTGGGDAKIAGYDYSFGATNSHRTKVGVRYAMSDLMDTKKFRPYIGLAWEREYKGDTVATVRGFGEAPSPSMKGNSGILEIGCKQEVGKWTLGIGAEVFTGKRKGWNGTLQATYNF